MGESEQQDAICSLSHEALLVSVSSPRVVTHVITNIPRSSLPRLDRRSRNSAVISQSCLLPTGLPLATISAGLSLRELLPIYDLYPVCRACHVNLPPAACRVDDLL